MSWLDRSITEGDCLLWTGTCSGDGYAFGYFYGKMYRVHQLVYEAYKELIPAGYDVCHSCDKPKCINPDHLFLGTARSNAVDMTRKGRAFNIKLSPEDVKAILISKEPEKVLATRYKVSVSLISKVKRRERKAWVSDA